jgi:hypothetical protein
VPWLLAHVQAACRQLVAAAAGPDSAGPLEWALFLARWLSNPCLLSLRLERAWYGMKRLWRNYSLSITLAGLFFVSWIGQLVTQWFTWGNDQQEHNQPLEVGGFYGSSGPAPWRTGSPNSSSY